MSFAERYLNSLNSSNLLDDEHHRATEALAAAALADLSGGSGVVFGTMLARAKIDGVPREAIGSGSHNLAVLLRVWKEAVFRKGQDRKWLKVVQPWDIPALEGICKKIALHSLAHWLGGECAACNGTKINAGRACTHCAATPGREPIKGCQLERERIADMVSDLEGLYQSHAARAGAKMRRTAPELSQAA
jgi:hypothetical protein